MVLRSVIMHLRTAVPASGPARLTMQTLALLCSPNHLSAHVTYSAVLVSGQAGVRQFMLMHAHIGSQKGESSRAALQTATTITTLKARNLSRRSRM